MQSPFASVDTPNQDDIDESQAPLVTDTERSAGVPQSWKQKLVPKDQPTANLQKEVFQITKPEIWRCQEHASHSKDLLKELMVLPSYDKSAKMKDVTSEQKQNEENPTQHESSSRSDKKLNNIALPMIKTPSFLLNFRETLEVRNA